MQMLSTFNAKLATKEPRPFVDSAANRVAERLRASSAAIIAEYHAYEASLKRRRGGVYDGDPESWMTQEDGGGHWEAHRHGPPGTLSSAATCRRRARWRAACPRSTATSARQWRPRGLQERGANLGTAGLVSFYRKPNRP